MGNTVKISFSAVTHTGASYTVNSDRIYADGRFVHPSAANYAQISLEKVDTKFFFALSGNMEDSDSGVSLMNDLKKFHQKSISSSKGINVKLDELVQCVEQSSNLIHSLSLGDSEFGDKKPNFAGILIDEGNVAAVNLGSYRIYKLEGDTFKLFVNDYKRAERLLKMGIISNEQAELLTTQQKASMEEGSTTVKKSDIYPLRAGITYLVCSTGLSDAVDEDTLYDILASDTEPDQAAAELVMEAVNNESEENISALVIKITEAEEDSDYLAGSGPIQPRMASGRVQPRYSGHAAASARRIPVDAGKIAAIVVLVLLSAAVLFGGYKIWKMLSTEAKETTTNQGDAEPTGGDATDSQGDQSSVTDEPTDELTDEPTDETPDDETVEDEPGAGTVPDGSGTGTIGPEGTTYTVKSGDMLMLIAKKFYGDENKYKLIMEANNIKDANMIYVGQKLIIPPDQ
jgi:nucleoid-associated protein YgaU